MSNPVVKSTVAVVLSIAAAILLFMVIEGVSSILHPWPEGTTGTPEEVARQVESYPAWVLVVLGGAGWGGTMLICTYLVTRIGHQRHPWHGYGIGLLLLAMFVFNLAILPYPGWYRAFMLIVMPSAALLGTRLAREESRGSNNSGSQAAPE